MSTCNNAFACLNEIMENTENILNEAENEVNTFDVDEANRLVNECDVILNGNSHEIDKITQYQNIYWKLFIFIEDKTKCIDAFGSKITNNSVFSGNPKFITILNKKKKNTNKVIDCSNRIVERIRQLEIIIFNNRMKELDDMLVFRYHGMKQEQQTIQPPVQIDKEINIINNSMEILKQWSNKSTFNIIFDSCNDENINCNKLHEVILNQNNLYFIHFDDKNNVFGEYVSYATRKLDESGHCSFYDKNAFVFSLIRKGYLKKSNYSLKQSENVVFEWFGNNSDGKLYSFGDGTIFVWKTDTGYVGSCYGEQDCHYVCDNEKSPLNDGVYPNGFNIQRLIIIQMY